MRGFFCEPRKPFSPNLKRKIFFGIFGWKLLTIKSTEFVLFLFLWGVYFLAWAHGLQIREIGLQIREIGYFFNFFNFGKVWNFQLRQSLKLCRSSLCRSFLCRSSLSRSSLCRSSLCWSSLCRSFLCRSSLSRSSLSRSSLCWSSLCWSSLCWSSLCWS